MNVSEFVVQFLVRHLTRAQIEGLRRIAGYTFLALVAVFVAILVIR